MTTAVDELAHQDDEEVYRQLEAARRAMSADLLRDPVTLARGLDRNFRMRPHLKLIGDALAEVGRGEYDRLLILTPPQVGKSTTVAEWFPFWWLCTFPVDKVAVTSYGDDLALRRGKRIRGYVEEYGDEWELRMKPGSGAMQDWEVTAGGGCRSVSVGKGLTGFDVNLLIIDDPHKDRADAESEAARRALHDWYSSAALSRLQPDRSAVVAIQTRWHPDDFAGRRIQEEGRIEDGGRWKVIHLPAVADPKFGEDPLGREPGEPLPHPKIPSRAVARLKAWWAQKKATSIVRDWHALYQGDPQPGEGALVSEELLRLLRDTTTPVEPQKIAVSIDPSGGGRDVAGVIGGFLGDDGRVWITDDVSAPMSSAEWSMAACRLAYRTNASIIYVEWNFGRDMCVLAIQTSWEKLQRDEEIPKNVLMPAILPVRAKQGKLLRAEPIAQQMVQDKVRFRGLFPDMEREWSTWQPTDPDSPGRIDASCVLVYGLIPEANAGAIVHAPLAQAPQGGARSGIPGSVQPNRPASPYGRRIGR
ncbi:terminase large subunit domain-containing protein [Streptomyces prunicolor]|uniref:terminase large subunit domain-containing protein n=1 Tax=Streptomyces prunicolor TaxID=67348 RepID=UPI000361D02B|nr:terminase family protein [Streptomyces prunicolor]